MTVFVIALIFFLNLIFYIFFFQVICNCMLSGNPISFPSLTCSLLFSFTCTHSLSLFRSLYSSYTLLLPCITRFSSVFSNIDLLEIADPCIVHTTAVVLRCHLILWGTMHLLMSSEVLSNMLTYVYTTIYGDESIYFFYY